MYGGPSQIDTFDYKPTMYGMDGKTIEVKTFGRGGHKNQGRIVEPKWKFKQYGQCGKWVSDLFPNLATCVDDIAFIHSMTADSPIHGSAMLQMNTGKILSGSPCFGSWVNYGLGHRQPEPARLRRDARSARRADQRRQELVQRLHARHLSGDRHQRGRHADSRPETSGRRSRQPMQRRDARHPARVQSGA